MEASPCDPCPATCCREPLADITFYDAFRIARALRLPIGDFVEVLWLERPEPERRLVVADNGRYYCFRLRKVEEAPEKQRCLFLHGVTAKRWICSIYALRPELCRTYPSYLEGGVLATSGGRYCPEGAWSPERMDVRALRSDWLMRERMQRLHDLLVDGWNERALWAEGGLTIGDLHGFVMNTCAELGAAEPPVFERPAPGAPLADPYPRERLAAVVDELLRRLGWRTDDTARHARPEIGRGPHEGKEKGPG